MIPMGVTSPKPLGSEPKLPKQKLQSPPQPLKLSVCTSDILIWYLTRKTDERDENQELLHPKTFYQFLILPCEWHELELCTFSLLFKAQMSK